MVFQSSIWKELLQKDAHGKNAMREAIMKGTAITIGYELLSLDPSPPSRDSVEGSGDQEAYVLEFWYWVLSLFSLPLAGDFAVALLAVMVCELWRSTTGTRDNVYTHGSVS